MPNGNIEKFRMEQRVGSLIFKHRGNIDKVVAECGADPDYVRTISERIQRKRKHEVNYDIACAISEEVLSGHQQETAHLIECLNDLTGYKDLVSPCCKVRMNRYIFDDEFKYICSKCNIEIMNVIEKQKNYKEIRAIIAELRKEREFLTEFAAKMGFVVPKQDGSSITPTVNDNRKIIGSQHIHLGQPGAKQVDSVVLNDEEQSLIEQARSLDPKTRESLRKGIESRMLEEGLMEEGTAECQKE